MRNHGEYTIKQETFDEIVVMSGGVKHDEGKVPYHLVSIDALEGMTEILQFGAAKYEDRNWEKGMSWSRPFAACLRHLFAWWRGEDLDPETGKSHLDHAACCVHFLSHYVKSKRYTKYDDRPIGDADGA